MKNRNNIPYIIVVLLITFIVLGVLLIRAYSPKYRWHENLVKQNKQPYGTSILYNLIKDSYSENNFTEISHYNIERYLKDETDMSYFYVGTNFFIDSANVKNLLEFTEKGNKVFIASTNHIEQFLYNLYGDSTLSTGIIKTINQDSIITSFAKNKFGGSDNFSFHFQFLKSTNDYPWQYFNINSLKKLTEDSYKILSFIDNDKPNLIALQFGKGKIYLHLNPIFFSNYHLLREQTFSYLQKVMDEIASEEIIWDSFSSYPFDRTSFSSPHESPLKVILGHKSFRWAWYLLLISILIYILFESKRKQNIIPLLPKKENNTLDYAKAIGALYFQTRNYKVITNEMMNQFNAFIKSRYKIKLGKDRESSVSILSAKSGIPEKDLKEIFQREIRLKYTRSEESKELFNLYYLINNFYRNCN